MMYVFGITGGIGSGKSEILQYMKANYHVHIILTDLVAKECMKPDGICYEGIRHEFAKDAVFHEDGSLDTQAMGKLIFHHPNRREALNQIVHPAVYEEVIQQIQLMRDSTKIDACIVESALLPDQRLQRMMDALWYIHTKREVRIRRLMESRGYTKEKCESIMATQLSDDEFLQTCDIVIDNNQSLAESTNRIDQILTQQFQMSKK